MNFIKQVLRRSPFPGQLRIFHYLFYKNRLHDKYKIAIPRKGNFMIYANSKNLIDASIIYLGDYEPDVKNVFRGVIKKGDTVLDVGANIGFHTLYFSELVGKSGKVVSFEPVPATYEILVKNIHLNFSSNIIAQNIALGDKDENLHIHINTDQNNPGSNNLFNKHQPNTWIYCKIGDQCINEMELGKIDFIKIDVEGYELFVLNGLVNTITKYQPKIVFEYDYKYQLKTDQTPYGIFEFLKKLNYSFLMITPNGLSEFNFEGSTQSADILALPVAHD